MLSCEQNIFLGVYLRSDDDEIASEFRGMGIRIEDDILITNNEPHILTKSCPKSVEEIERIMKHPKE